MKFQFNLTKQTLQITHGKNSLTLSQRWQFTAPYGSTGFYLEPNHWIIFSLYQEQVQAFYKIPTEDNSAIYYQRELTRPASGIIEVEFSKWDRMIKGRNKSEQ